MNLRHTGIRYVSLFNVNVCIKIILKSHKCMTSSEVLHTRKDTQHLKEEVGRGTGSGSVCIERRGHL